MRALIILMLMLVLGLIAVGCGDMEASEVDLLIEEAVAFARTGDVDGVLAALDEAIAVDSDHARSYLLRGEVLLIKKDPTLAEADFDSAIGIDGQLVAAYVGRGRARYAGVGSGQLSESDVEAYVGALSDFEKVVMLDPLSANGYAGRCMVRGRWGLNIELTKEDGALEMLDAAFDDCSQAIEIQDDQVTARLVRLVIAGSLELLLRIQGDIRRT